MLIIFREVTLEGIRGRKFLYRQISPEKSIRGTSQPFSDRGIGYKIAVFPIIPMERENYFLTPAIFFNIVLFYMSIPLQQHSLEWWSI